MSGRLPTHLGEAMHHMQNWDGGSDPVWGYDGMPPATKMTIFPKMLKDAGYKTHHIGKADGFGGATMDHLPHSRGFDSALSFFSHSIDNYHWSIEMDSAGTEGCEDPDDPNRKYRDLWEDDHPATELCEKYADTVPVDEILTDRAVDIINNHDQASGPMFMFYSPKSPHTNLDTDDADEDWAAQKMCEYNDQCLNRKGQCSFSREGGALTQSTGTFSGPVGTCALVERLGVLAMMRHVDRQIGRLRSALETSGMWDNTLVVFTSDNGGGIGVGIGGNNYPLQGGKGGALDGGMRTVAFVSGGYVSKLGGKPGSRSHGVMHLADWSATFAALAGADTSDPVGDAAGVPPVDGVNQIKMILGQVDDVRDSLLAESNTLFKKIDGTWYKLGRGDMATAIHTPAEYPTNEWNALQRGNPTPFPPAFPTVGCGEGCLFKIFEDPAERTNVAEQFPDIANDLKADLERLTTKSDTEFGYFEPWCGCEYTEIWCKVAKSKWGGHYGPWLDVPDCADCVSSSDPAASGIRPNTNECHCQLSRFNCRRSDDGSDSETGCKWDDGVCEAENEEKVRGFSFSLKELWD